MQEFTNFPASLRLIEMVNGVKLTPRELDIMACILNGRTVKTIASFLSIAPKTAEHHIRSITLKLGCNSQEGVRDFIEKTGKTSLFRKHYQWLLVQVDFRKRLAEIFKILYSKTITCCFHYGPGQQESLPLLCAIEGHLKQAGVRVIVDRTEDSKFEKSLLSPESPIDSVIYVVSDALIKKFYVEDDSAKLTQTTPQLQRRWTFLSLEKETLSVPQDFYKIGYLALHEQKSYYHFIFEVLKKLAPDANLEKIIKDFAEAYELKKEGSLKELSPPQEAATQNHALAVVRALSGKWRVMTFAAFGLFSIYLGSLYFKGGMSDGERQPQERTIGSIRSDLIIPEKGILLKRPRLMARINEGLKETQGIQTVVLVGIGGAGKTTLARQYLRSQKFPVVWEINAETQESLIGSFESLAYALSKTSEEKGDLDAIQQLNDVRERTKRILFFVKKKLKEQKEWSLLFDNVESFSDIKEFYPLDTETWGIGKVLMTTRDGTIKNNIHINPRNVLDIEELDENEKLTLFTDIIFCGDTSQDLRIAQTEERKAFLKEIPPFPLDISIAAHYIKDTKISYEDYIRRLQSSSEDFEKAQETFLKETSDYTKTRYRIISLALNNIIGENQDFKELLLFVSLLDSQNIPKELLELYKKSTVVEQFARDLRKQSLVTAGTFGAGKLMSTFSIHRSTQEICLNYLKTRLNSLDYDKGLQACTKTLIAYINDALSQYEDQKIRLLAGHGELFLEHGNLLESVNSKKVDQIIDFLNCLGLVHKTFGDYRRAEDFFYRGHQICKKYYGKDHIKLASMLSGLGESYIGEGNYERSKDCYREALSLCHKNYGENHEETIWILIQLGVAYKGLGQFIEAKQAYERALKISQKLSLSDRVGWALVRLGAVLRILGDHKKAKNLIEQGLAIHNKLYGASNVRNRWILAALGNAHRSLGDYKIAQELLEQSFTMYKKHYGEFNIRTSWVLVHLGNVYGCLGYFEKAVGLLENSLSVYKKYRSINSPEVAWVSIHLGNVYRCFGDYARAKPLLEKGLEIYRKSFGNDHILTGWALHKLGKVYLSICDYEKARLCFEESLTIYNKHYGLNHVNLAEIFLGLGQYHLLTHDLEKAESFLNQSKQLYTKNNHPGVMPESCV